MKTKSMTILLLLVLLVSQAACTNHYKEQFNKSQNNLGQRNEQDYRQMGENRSWGYIRKGGNHHNNKRMQFDQRTATEIGKMAGVAAAHVIITDINAYVGIAIDDAATGTSELHNRRDTDNTGESEGSYDARDASPYADPRKMVTDRNSYFTLPDANDISAKLKQKIAVRVRQLHPQVQEVFISSNRDFVNYLNEFAIHYWTGKSLEDDVESFNRNVIRYFPPPPDAEPES